jgi:drug/metabolite transporter (DMT)-like permease
MAPTPPSRDAVVTAVGHARRGPSTGDLALSATVITWACAFPAIRVGLEGFSPWSLGLLRLGFASVTLAALATVVSIKVPPRTAWPRVILAGLLGQTLYQGLLMTGELTVPAGTASILIATAPLFSVVAAAVVLGEPMRGKWTGMVVAFAGTVLVGASLGLGASSAGLFVLAAAVCQGLYHVVVKPLAESVGALSATAWSVWAGSVMALVGLPALRTDVATAPTSSWWAAVFLGVVPSALGYLAWSAAVSRTTIARSTSALYLVPVVALILAWAWLGERPSPLAVVGGALAVLGVVLARRNPTTSTQRTAPQSAAREQQS